MCIRDTKAMSYFVERVNVAEWRWHLLGVH